MKLNNKPSLYRTIIGEVEHKGKVYQVTIEQIGEDENSFDIFEIKDDISVNPDSDLGKELIEFFERETEDIEQFL